MMNSVTSCSDHTKIIVSLLRDMQLNDQRATLLQLVDKFKAKWKNLGKFPQPTFFFSDSSKLVHFFILCSLPG